jgi:hypothetical protein
MASSSSGNAATNAGGKTLASLVLGSDDEWSSLPVVGPPVARVLPEPLRWPALQAFAWPCEAGDRAEEGSRPRGFASRAAGRVMPS